MSFRSWVGETALFDAGPGANPFVARLELALELARNDAGGQEAHAFSDGLHVVILVFRP